MKTAHNQFLPVYDVEPLDVECITIEPPSMNRDENESGDCFAFYSLGVDIDALS